MYSISLINLTADARSAVDSSDSIERGGVTEAEMRRLLQSFCEIDPVGNAVAAPEIRVKVRHEIYLIRTGQKKLMLYDIVHREIPALVLTLDEVMAELDGSAQAGRSAAAFRPPVAAPGESVSAYDLPAYPVAPASRPRVIVMGVVALVLLGVLGYLHFGETPVPAAQFHPVGPGEAAELQSTLPGVYLTGNQPGQHGIVVVGAGELKLFELGALNAPRIVHASGKLGRVGTQPALATDQPGGLIEIKDRDTLVYCGEVYRRIP